MLKILVNLKIQMELFMKLMKYNFILQENIIFMGKHMILKFKFYSDQYSEIIKIKLYFLNFFINKLVNGTNFLNFLIYKIYQIKIIIFTNQILLTSLKYLIFGIQFIKRIILQSKNSHLVIINIWEVIHSLLVHRMLFGLFAHNQDLQVVQ